MNCLHVGSDGGPSRDLRTGLFHYLTQSGRRAVPAYIIELFGHILIDSKYVPPHQRIAGMQVLKIDHPVHTPFVRFIASTGHRPTRFNPDHQLPELLLTVKKVDPHYVPGARVSVNAAQSVTVTRCPAGHAV